MAEPVNSNIIAQVGRKKKGYSGPTGLVRHPGSQNWYIHWRNIYKSTGTSDLDKARLIFIEVQKMVLTEEVKAREILGRGISFRKLIKRYLKEITSKKRHPADDQKNSKHPLEFFGDRHVDTITAQDIYKYMDGRSTMNRQSRKSKTIPNDNIPLGKISGATVNRELSFMSDLFKKAIRWGEIQINPCLGIERFEESSRERYITDEELAAIQKIAQLPDDSKHLDDIVTALYYTGQRSGRILNLK